MVDEGRPGLHFTPSEGWINDPVALVWRRDRYHLFFQAVPHSTTWTPDCSWGHATSADLTTWRDQPAALVPGDGDDGVWSGSLVADASGRGTIFYTSVRQPTLGIGRVRTAFPADEDWTTWRKGSTVIPAPPSPAVTMFRDPHVFSDVGGWGMLVGASLDETTGAVLLYRSPDLETWRYAGVAARRPAAETEPSWTGSGWECPQLRVIDGRHVLLVSVWDRDRIFHTAYSVGEWGADGFKAGPWRRLTYGSGYYAASAFDDQDGRPGLIHWIRGVGGATWTGSLSVPHLLSVAGDRLIARPHDRLTAATARVDARTGDAVETEDAVFVAFRLGEREEVEVRQRGFEPVRIARDDGFLAVRAGDRRPERVPAGSGAATALLDGPVLEVWSDAGVLAGAIGRSGSV